MTAGLAVQATTDLPACRSARGPASACSPPGRPGRSWPAPCCSDCATPDGTGAADPTPPVSGAGSARPVRAQAVDEDVDHAPAVLGALAGHRLAQQRDRVSGGPGADVGADPVGRRGCVEECLEHGADALPEVAGQRVVGAVRRSAGPSRGPRLVATSSVYRWSHFASAAAGALAALSDRARVGAGVDLAPSTAMTRSERRGKCRYSVPTPTPASVGDLLRRRVHPRRRRTRSSPPRAGRRCCVGRRPACGAWRVVAFVWAS